MTRRGSRRAFLGSLGASVGMLPLIQPVRAAAKSQSKGSKPMFAFVGCRTTKERNARGEGIGVFRIDEPGQWTRLDLFREIVNPSFLLVEPSRRCLYALHGDMSEVSAFRIDGKSGALTLLGTQSTRGRNPVHLVVTPNRQNLVVANYATGTVASLPIKGDGSLGEVREPIALPGEPGPHRLEQTSSHPHGTTLDRTGKFLLVPDKGLDRVFVFRVTADGVAPHSPFFVQGREGAGCRHVSFHPTLSMAYVVNELDSSVTAYRWDPVAGSLFPVQVIPSVPGDFTGNNRAAEIAVHPDGHHLYVSNRGHDSIACVALDPRAGMMTSHSWLKSGGRGPRFFSISPDRGHLHVANELTDTIVGYALDNRGVPTERTDLTLPFGSPTCIDYLC